MTGWERIEQLMALGHSRTVALRIVKKENQAAKARREVMLMQMNSGGGGGQIKNRGD